MSQLPSFSSFFVLCAAQLSPPAIQGPLEQICVSTPSLDIAFPSFKDKGSLSWGTPTTPRRRALAAKEGGDGGGPCPDGTSLLFPAGVFHALHIMLFLVAATQIVYSCLVLALCLWKVSRWRRFELQAQREPGLLQHIHGPGDGCCARYRRLKQQAVEHLSNEASRDWVRHFTAAGILMFSSVDAEQYIVMRHIFIHQLGLDHEFDYLEFVKSSMEEEFASMVGVNTFMWLILFVWIALPPETYVSIWVPMLMLCLVLVLGVKLSSVMLVFHHRAKQAWACSSEAAKEMAMRPRSAKADGADRAVPLGNLRRNSLPVGEGDEALRSRSIARDSVITEPIPEHGPADQEEPPAPEPPRRGSGKAGRQHPPEGRREPPAELSLNLSEILGQGEDSKVPQLGHCCWVPSVSGEDEEDEDGSGESQRGGSSRGGWHRGRSTPFPDKSLVRMLRGKDWIQRKYHKASTDSAELFWGRKPYIILRLLQLVYFGMSIQLALSIFTKWMDLPPGYLMPIFAGYGGIYDMKAQVSAGTIIFELFTNLFVLVWCSLFVLPVYALCSTVGSHCPSSVLTYARKHMVEPKLIKALQAAVALNKLNEDGNFDAAASEITGSARHSQIGEEEPRMEQLLDDIIDAHLDQNLQRVSPASVGHGGKRNEASIQRLMGAMYSAQLNKLKAKRLAEDGDGCDVHPSGTSTWHAVPNPEANKSLSSIRSLFRVGSEQNINGKTASDDSEATAGGSDAPNPSLATPASARDGANDALQLQRLAQKQQLLMSIVGRQERLRRVSEEESRQNEDVHGGSKTHKRQPYSLARHSMSASLGVNQNKQQVPADAQRPPLPLLRPSGFSLARSSAGPRMQHLAGSDGAPLSPTPASAGVAPQPGQASARRG
uniref:Mlo protein n=1 Tax=Tetraselmis sp. GSL018 TaxID=582737 RepID=A0A061RFB7_9CHLO